MGVLMQAFYWDCPQAEGQDGAWWNYVSARVASLRDAGFTALWLPPACKAANLGGPSMGYDPYDYYDLGDFAQKGRTRTWFGNRAELEALLATAHACGLQVYADLVLDHNNGGDAAVENPLDHQTRYTEFKPLSGLFPRSWECFHPSPYERWDDGTFGDLPDLCHRNPYVYTEVVKVARWMIEQIGFDGFRFDFVKGYGGWLVRALAEVRYVRDGQPVRPFGVGEFWDGEQSIEAWLAEANAFSDNPVCAFDFPLHYRLKDLCDRDGFSLRELATDGTVLRTDPARALTFVDNHDTVRDPASSVVHEKLLAYAFVLTHEGYPSVFWQDYFNFGLAREGTPTGIAALVRAHEQYAGGGTEVLYVDDDLYVMQRTGAGEQAGLVFVLNNRGDGWNGTRVVTRWPGRTLAPVAWGGRDASAPERRTAADDGGVELWASPRGYAVYAPA